MLRVIVESFSSPEDDLIGPGLSDVPAVNAPRARN